eukprot:gene328-262_t
MSATVQGNKRGVYVAALKNKLKELYEEYNAANVDKIEYLLGKYVGQEELLYASVCKKYSLDEDPLTTTVKQWDAATGKNSVQIICTTSGDVLDQVEEAEDNEDEYDPFDTAGTSTEQKAAGAGDLEEIDKYLLGETVSDLFKYPGENNAIGRGDDADL